ncbi:hypothetical protein AKO1_009119 [Acrasis kona]|uniref:Uncharacterized protein n=1 Tax=Acrasis kona TaxID=1008807 RepID=A0AAW2ZLU7_9EUKA
MLMSHLSLMVFLSLAVFYVAAEQKTLVVMRVFSSRKNPQWYVDGVSRDELLRIAGPLYGKEEHKCNRQGSKLGYTGFNIIDSSNDECVYVVNSVEAESYLLSTYVKFMTMKNEDPNALNSVVEHVKTVISTGVQTELVPESPVYPAANEVIRGPDHVANYSPDTWNLNLKALLNNNCYNYGTDVRTDTFAQPGRGSGRMWSGSMNCTMLLDVCTRDGLIPLKSKQCPVEEQPKIGHYVSLVIWSGVDYHWYRKDAGGYWSHKPGIGNVTDIDASHNKILNPDKADITPYKEICGYFIVVPSKITIE